MKQVINKLKGEVTTFAAIVAGAATIIASMIGGYAIQSKASNDQIQKVRDEALAQIETAKKSQSDTNERVAKLEEAVLTLKTTVPSMEKDIKELLRRVK